MANASSEVPHIGPLENSSVATLPAFFSRLLICRPAPATRKSTASANLHDQPSPIQSEHQSLHMRICDKELLGLPTELELHPAFKNEYSLITILPVPNELQISAFWLRERIHHFLEIDDVFSREFLAGIVFNIGPDGQLSLTDDVSSLLASWGTRLIGIVQDTVPVTAVTAGPHLIAHGSLWQVFGLQDDTNSTFVSAFVPRAPLGTKDQAVEHLKLASSAPQTLRVAVPSRMQSRQPGALEGARVSVKDMFQIHGLTTSLCNRAYYRLGSPSTGTAASIETLRTKGALLIGANKLSSLISREEPTEAVDYQAPFNPRGDGYQSPAGSSSGSAAAIASYPWLDLSIGNDTSGSGRRPALANGVFQFRPTHDLLDLTGMTPTFLQFDTPCVFARDLCQLEYFAKEWYEVPNKNEAGRPTRIVRFADYHVNDPGQAATIDDFLTDLEATLDTQSVQVSLAELWKKTAPAEVAGRDLETWLADVVVQTYYRDFYDSTSSFRKQYNEKFGKEPYVNSFVHWRWNLGKKVSDGQRAEGLRRIELYRAWLLQHVLQTHLFKALVILPISHVQPTYRDAPPGPPSVQSGFDPLYFVPILAGPDVVLPIGEVKYHSRITDRDEYLPMAIDLVASPGEDRGLLDTAIKCLRKAGRPLSVKTGSRMFV